LCGIGIIRGAPIKRRENKAVSPRRRKPGRVGNAYARRPITFQPSHNVFLLTNFKPRANPDDYALWQRIYIIQFPLSFVDDPQRTTSGNVNPHLLKKLYGETSGILSWLIRGCLSIGSRASSCHPDKSGPMSRLTERE